MDRRRKVELFEQIRREYTHGVGTIQGTARKIGVHRCMVRQALASALQENSTKRRMFVYCASISTRRWIIAGPITSTVPQVPRRPTYCST